MPAQLPLTLSEKEQARLTSAIRSKLSPPRLVMRANIILLAAQHIPSYKIARQLNLSKDTVGLWRRRYLEEGYRALLKDRPRGKNQGGKSTIEQEKLRQLIIKKTTTQTPQGQTHWSTRTMAAAVGSTHSFVNRVWNQAGLKPHLSKTFKVSNDPTLSRS